MVLLWEFDILPAPGAKPIKPRNPDCVLEELDLVLTPVDPDRPRSCNCFVQPIKPVCLVDIPTHIEMDDDDGDGSHASASHDGEGDGHDGVGGAAGVSSACGGNGSDVQGEIDEISQLTEILDIEEVNNDGSGEEVLFPERFVVVGSWQEQIYQKGLAICGWRRSRNLRLQFRIEAEPANLKDTNAMKFSVFHNDEWHVIGYCGVTKIPKLKKAVHKKEIYSVILDSLKRTYAYKEKEFLFSAALMIVKRERWEKDDPYNNYNTYIDLR